MRASSIPVRVYFNGRFLSQPITGTQRYGTELLKALDQRMGAAEIDPHTHTLTVLIPRGKKPSVEFHHLRVQETGWFHGKLWEQIDLPLRAGRTLLVSFSASAPVLKRRHIVAIHDAAVFATPKAYTRLYRAWYRAAYRLQSHLALRVLTVSEFSRSELARFCSIAPDRISVISEGAQHLSATTPDETILDRLRLRGQPFVLAVSSLNPNKNFAAVVSAMQLLGNNGYKFLVVGERNDRVFNSSGLPESDRLLWADRVSDAQLLALYGSARCLVFPSLYEGFGIPPLEAMWCGCPVVVARAASLPEVCGDAVLYCDPHSPQDIARQLSRVLSDDSLREQLRREGLARAEKFSWQESARRLWEIIERHGRRSRASAQ